MPGEWLRLAILVADIVAVPAALFTAYLLRYGSSVRAGLSMPVPWGSLLIVAAAVLAWLMLYRPMELDCFKCGWQLPAVISRVTLGVTLDVGAVLTAAYLVRMYYSRLVLTYFALMLFTLILLVRLVAYWIVRPLRHAGKRRKVVIIGEGSVARELAVRIERHPELLAEVLGFLRVRNGSGFRVEEAGDQPRGMGSLEALNFLQARGVEEVIVALEDSPGLGLGRFVEHCRASGIQITLVPQVYQLYSARARLVEIDGVPLISLYSPVNLKLAGALKRVMDLAFGTILLLAAFPVILLAGIGLWCQGRRFLRREWRCGQYGQPFLMYRLDVDRKALDVPPLQRFLRQTSLSELPQLFNVLAGHMSLVGPRPETPERVRDYSEWQRQRLDFRPGMTGLAQVSGLREQHSSDEKTRYDLRYMLNWTPAVDLVLLLQTAWTLVTRRRCTDGALETRPQSARLWGEASAASRSITP
jgi:lipopolysaccharide/colanic/teichoic acid biosynthesis glycosyltransferase